MAAREAELLIGEGCHGDAFNDTRLAVALDNIAEVGVDVIMGDVVGVYLATEEDDRQLRAPPPPG